MICVSSPAPRAASRLPCRRRTTFSKERAATAPDVSSRCQDRDSMAECVGRNWPFTTIGCPFLDVHAGILQQRRARTPCMLASTFRAAPAIRRFGDLGEIHELGKRDCVLALPFSDQSVMSVEIVISREELVRGRHDVESRAKQFAKQCNSNTFTQAPWPEVCGLEPLVRASHAC